MTTITKQFTCDHCNTAGQIILEDSDAEYDDIVLCPVCGGEITTVTNPDEDYTS